MFLPFVPLQPPPVRGMGDVLQDVIQLAPPALEPVTITEARAHMRIEEDEDTADVALKLAAARAEVEAYTGRSLYRQKWRAFLSAFPNYIELPKPPTTSVELLQYVAESDGTLVAMNVNGAPPLDVRVMKAGAWTIEPPWIQSSPTPWPQTARVRGAVQVDFTAGYTDGGVAQAGTITTTGTAVVGAGTAFANALVGQTIQAGGQYLAVTAVADATHLTVAAPGFAPDIAAAAWALTQEGDPLKLIPRPLKLAVLLFFGVLYEAREAFMDVKLTEQPWAARLLDKWRVWRVG